MFIINEVDNVEQQVILELNWQMEEQVQMDLSKSGDFLYLQCELLHISVRVETFIEGVWFWTWELVFVQVAALPALLCDNCFRFIVHVVYRCRHGLVLLELECAEHWYFAKTIAVDQGILETAERELRLTDRLCLDVTNIVIVHFSLSVLGSLVGNAYAQELPFLHRPHVQDRTGDLQVICVATDFLLETIARVLSFVACQKLINTEAKCLVCARFPPTDHRFSIGSSCKIFICPFVVFWLIHA